MTHEIDLYGDDLRRQRERKRYEELGVAELYDELQETKAVVRKLASQMNNTVTMLADATDQIEDTQRWRSDVNAVLDEVDWANVTWAKVST